MNDNRCPRCREFSGSSVHVSYDCSFAKQVWLVFNFHWPNLVNDYSFTDWLSWIFVHLENEKKIEATIAIWALWYARNKFVHEKQTSKVEETVTFIRGFGK